MTDHQREKTPLSRFKQQRVSAKDRGIPFRLSYEQWLDIWKQSGHFHERGRGRGKYCMSRPGDKGAYERGNVKIILFEANNVEQICSPKTRAKLSALRRGRKPSALAIAKLIERNKTQAMDYHGRKRAPEFKEKIRATLMGHTVSAASRAKMSAAAYKRSAATKEKKHAAALAREAR